MTTKPLDSLRQWRIANNRHPEHGCINANGSEKRRLTARKDLTLIRAFASQWANWDSREGEAMVEIVAMCIREPE